MSRILSVTSLAFLLSISAGLGAQSSPSANFIAPEDGVTLAANRPMPVSTRPFSRVAVSGNVSPLGIGAEITTNLTSRLNLRASGSMFNYDTTFNTNGFAADAKVKLASTRTSIDVYPFHAGFRISPGIMFYNQNRVTANETVAGGTSFTLNDDTFYSANPNPVTGAVPVSGSALLNLHSTRPAFTITGGWGNAIARSGHLSFPVEVGVGFVGAPSLNANLNGWACYDQAQTQCVNVADPNNAIAVQVQSDLQTQIGKWTHDLEPLKTYPIISAGVAYSFNVGRRR